MIGKTPGYYFTFCWRFSGPILIFLIFGASMYKVFASDIVYTSYNAALVRNINIFIYIIIWTRISVEADDIREKSCKN